MNIKESFNFFVMTIHCNLIFVKINIVNTIVTLWQCRNNTFTFFFSFIHCFTFKNFAKCKIGNSSKHRKFPFKIIKIIYCHNCNDRTIVNNRNSHKIFNVKFFTEWRQRFWNIRKSYIWNINFTTLLYNMIPFAIYISRKIIDSFCQESCTPTGVPIENMFKINFIISKYRNKCIISVIILYKFFKQLRNIFFRNRFKSKQWSTFIKNWFKFCINRSL